MSYRKGLQILMMAVLLFVGMAVLNACVQGPASNPALQNLQALQEQSAARYQAGDYAGAERFARQALAVAEHAVGSEHPDTAASLNNLAVVLQAQGRVEEAEPLLRRALAIQEQVLGAEHPATAGSLNNLAVVLQAQCRSGGRPSRFTAAPWPSSSRLKRQPTFLFQAAILVTSW